MPLLDAKGQPLYRWQVRIRSEEPTLIEFSEQHYQHLAPMNECGTLVHRTSYMVGAPNREVFWAVDIWKKGQWECIIDGKSTLPSEAKPA